MFAGTQVERLVNASDPAFRFFNGLKWAQPNVAHLRSIMRHVYEHREEGRAKGRAARQRMVEKFSPEVVAQLVVKELRRVDALIP